MRPIWFKWERTRIALILTLLCSAKSYAADKPSGLNPILNYISASWDALSRSMTDCSTIVDPKVIERSVVYLPQGFEAPPKVDELSQKCGVKIDHLASRITGPGQSSAQISPPGLLYLPNRYVVPGGRFNEMYGWDSYFIVVGLLRSGRVDLAKGMVDNFFFEIENYGSILNANRTYYLTRSQPPFLTSMILDVYAAEKAAGHDDREWLAKSYAEARKAYELWVQEPHLAGKTGLSRYYDFGEGPVPEGLKDESAYYRKVAEFYLDHTESAKGKLIPVKEGEKNPEAVGFTFPVQLCESMNDSAESSRCQTLQTYSLTRDYYKGDRSMRESGFDISFRFGPFSGDTHLYAPVCLNSLLYKTETDLEKMSTLLSHPTEASTWRDRAEHRKQLMNKYLWDEGRGLFMDYNFVSESRSSYPYVTTFYPLWSGLATPAQAKSLAKNLPMFEHPGGLAMSTQETGVQWDLPYGWAPLQLLAAGGLRAYGFDKEANRISYEFMSTVAADFARTGTIVEKYNVVSRSSETHISAGYRENQIGFGWTNGVFLELMHGLPEEWVTRLAKEQSPSKIADTAPAR